jgi:hypothetical protein
MKATMKRLSYSYLLLASLGSGALMATYAPRGEEPLLQSQPPFPSKSWMNSQELKENFPPLREVDYNNPDYRTLLAKTNKACELDGQVSLHRLPLDPESKKALLPNKNPNKSSFATLSQEINMPIVLLDVNGGKTTFGFFPYFFNKLSIFSSDGRTNTCLPGRLYDDTVIQALGGNNLGSGPGWDKRNSIPNWRELFKQGIMLFFICFNGKLFIMTPESVANLATQGVTSSAWTTPILKKTAAGLGAGLGAAAVLSATAYGIANPYTAWKAGKRGGRTAWEAGKVVGKTALKEGKDVAIGTAASLGITHAINYATQVHDRFNAPSNNEANIPHTVESITPATRKLAISGPITQETGEFTELNSDESL